MLAVQVQSLQKMPVFQVVGSLPHGFALRTLQTGRKVGTPTIARLLPDMQERYHLSWLLRGGYLRPSWLLLLSFPSLTWAGQALSFLTL